MPTDGGDCLCPDCLRKLARTARGRRCNVTGRWNVSAVLLDMDGTLLDTEQVYFDSLVAALNAHGYTDDTIRSATRWSAFPVRNARPCCTTRYGESFPLAEINRAFVSNRDEILTRDCR